MGLVIAGERSGVGKTTVTLSLLAYLHKKGFKVQSFKVGPDYIDPMFHQYVTGKACRNLDPVLTSQSYIQECFTRHSQGAEYALIEGVMGLFDGVSGVGENQANHNFASTAHIARLLDLPVLLVIDCSRLSGSVAAIAHGYRSFDPQIKLAGVVLNRVGSDRHLELLKNALTPLNLPVLGVMRRQAHITIPDRHLGLVPTGELSQLDNLIDSLAQIGETCFDWEILLPMLRCQAKSSLPASAICHLPSAFSSVKIAIAYDQAFNFYYQDNLDLLQQLGAELAFWSPLKDAALPPGTQALYFGGGFPEVFAEKLAENKSALDAVKRAILAGMPTYAECGGLMYLCEQITDFEGRSHSLVGILPTTAVMSDRLTLGYRQAVALQDSPILTTGDTIVGHEFHRSQLNQLPTQPLWKIQGYSASSQVTPEGWQINQVHASYVHLHWGANPQIPQRLIASAAVFQDDINR